MGLLNRLAHRLNQPMPAVQAPQVRANYSVGVYQLGRPVWAKANLTSYLGAYEQVVVVYSAINLIADAAASAKVRVYDESKDDAELPNHPLRALLRTPNTYMSESEFYNSMVKIAAVTGFAVAEKERSGAGRSVALHPLRSDWLLPIPRDDNMTDWQYQPPGADKQTLLAEDVIAWTYQGSPILSPTGTSPLCAANREIGIDSSMTDFTKSFFDSGGVPTVGLVVADDAEYDQAEADQIREKFKGIRGQPWEPVVLQAIKDVKRLGFDLNEMAYKDLKNLTTSQICSAFRIHPLLIDLLVGLENAPWSEFRTARRSFYEDTISPLWSRLDGALTRSLLPDFESNGNISLEFDTSEIPALQDDDTARWALISQSGAQKIATVNELRAEVDLPAISGGDVRILSMADIEVPATVQQGQRSNGHTSVEWREVPPLPLVSGAMYRLPAEQRATIAQTAKSHIQRLGERAAPLLRHFWALQGQRVLDGLGLRGDEPAIEVRAVAELDWAEENRELAQVLGRIYATSGEAAFAATSSFLGVDVAWDLANVNVQRMLGELAQRVTGINETTRTELQHLIADQLDQGVTLPQLATAIQDQFDGYGDARAMTTSRTETQLSYNMASALGYKESGLVSRVEMLDNPNHGDYSGDADGYTCAQRNGMIIPVENVSIHAQGTHPNCVLSIAPLLDSALGEGG
jgi:HK97 family phage portal protein